MKNTKGIPVSGQWLQRYFVFPFDVQFSEVFLTKKFTLHFKDLELRYKSWHFKVHNAVLKLCWGKVFTQKHRCIDWVKIFNGMLERNAVPLLTNVNAETCYREKLGTVSLNSFFNTYNNNTIVIHTAPICIKEISKFLLDDTSPSNFDFEKFKSIKGFNFNVRISSNLETHILFYAQENAFLDDKIKAGSICGNATTTNCNVWHVKGFLENITSEIGSSPRISFRSQYNIQDEAFLNTRLGGVWHQTYIPGINPIFCGIIPYFDPTEWAKLPYGKCGLIEPRSNTRIFLKNSEDKGDVFCGKYVLNPHFLETLAAEKFFSGIQFHKPITGSFTADSDCKKLDANFCLRDILHHGTHLESAAGQIKISKDKIVLGIDNLKAKNFALNGKLKYNFSTAKGQILAKGNLDPTCLNPYASKLPKWWQSFWDSFAFSQFPSGDIAIDFNAHDPNDFFCFGNVLAKDFRFNNAAGVEEFQLKFVSLPGYCWFFSPLLRTDSGVMFAEVGWPYSVENATNERWNIKASANIALGDWSAILAFFDPENTNPFLSLLTNLNDCPKINLDGRLYGAAYSGKIEKPLNITANFDAASIFHLPCKNVEISMRKWPEALFCDNFRLKLEDEGEGQGNFQITNRDELFFQLRAHQIQTKILFENMSFLTKWADENVNAYNGQLSGLVTGQGILGQPQSFEVHGQASFTSKNLAQIHLFGPLSELLSKTPTPFALSSVTLNEAFGDFQIKNLRLTSPNVQITGPTTNVSGKGEINLENSAVSAHIRFSFLDYQRIKLPIMRHLFRVLQPVSKGFEAKLSGSFQHPKWVVWFNPLRFLTP